jgi:hypothetical protein
MHATGLRYFPNYLPHFSLKPNMQPWRLSAMHASGLRYFPNYFTLLFTQTENATLAPKRHAC